MADSYHYKLFPKTRFWYNFCIIHDALNTLKQTTKFQYNEDLQIITDYRLIRFCELLVEPADGP